MEVCFFLLKRWFEPPLEHVTDIQVANVLNRSTALALQKFTDTYAKGDVVNQ
jgi:hypothetical protein